MATDLLYRVLFLVGLALSFSISGYHRKRAQQAGQDEINPEQEGPIILNGRRVMGIAMLGTALLYLIRPRWLAWAMLPVPEWMRIASAAYALVVSPILLYWVFSNLGDNVTTTVIARRENRLVTSGPYRWIRHPLYTVGIFGWVVTAIFTRVWLFALYGVVAFVLIAFRTSIEERRLVEKHGDAYRDYMRRTGRFLPKLDARAG